LLQQRGERERERGNAFLMSFTLEHGVVTFP